jgi:hypothetical protein
MIEPGVGDRMGVGGKTLGSDGGADNGEQDLGREEEKR